MTIDSHDAFTYIGGCEGCGDMYAELDPVSFNGRILMLCADCIEAMDNDE